MASAAATNRRAWRRASSNPAADSSPAAAATSEPSVSATPASPLHRGQYRSLVLRQDRIDDLAKRFAAHHLVDLVQRQVDAVVGHPPLREIVGADTLRSIAAANLVLALGGARTVARLAFHVVET